jgi:hypothetical protein
MLIKHFFLFIFLFALSFKLTGAIPADDKVINDYSYKFTVKIPDTWESRDMKETKDKDGISYSFERKDKKMGILLLAFKLSSVKNLDDFIYNMEKDISLNIPTKSGDYTEQDFTTYDSKYAMYKDDKFHEVIYYLRTKLPDAPNNYVYMIRFVSEAKDFNSDTETEIKNIASTFKPTAE